MAQLGNLIVTGVAKLLSKLYVSDSVTAPTFIGKLQGNADTATKVNGHTVNSDVPSGAKFTDTNTWRGIQNNLTSDSTSDSLSAAQGKVLKRLVDGKAASSHTHSYAGSSSAGGDATNATKWGGYTNDIQTNNTGDTWLLVANNTKIQHRLATDFAKASHTHSYLPLSGGTLTGRSTRAGGGSWISDRNNVALFGTATNSDSYNCIVGQKTPKGAWTIGNLGSNENLVFNYTTDTNFNAGTNTTNAVYLPPTGGTIALTNIIQYGTSAPSSLANGHLFCVIE